MAIFQYQGKAEPVLVPVEAPIDFAWFQSPGQPTRRRPRAQTVQVVGPFVVSPPDLSWLTDTVQPIVARRSIAGTNVLAPLQPEESTIDLSWLVPVAMPVDRRRRSHGLSILAPLQPIETVPDLSWFSATSQPTRTVRRAAGGTTVTPLEPTLTTSPPDLSWYQPLSLPPRPRKATAYQIVGVLDPSVFVVTLATLKAKIFLVGQAENWIAIEGCRSPAEFSGADHHTISVKGDQMARTNKFKDQYRGQDLVFEFQFIPETGGSANITGWTFRFELVQNGEVKFSQVPTPDFTDPTNGEMEFALVPADLADLDPGDYDVRLWRTNTGSTFVLADGCLKLL